jgi:hypothetical protein
LILDNTGRVQEVSRIEKRRGKGILTFLPTPKKERFEQVQDPERRKTSKPAPVREVSEQNNNSRADI